MLDGRGDHSVWSVALSSVLMVFEMPHPLRMIGGSPPFSRAHSIRRRASFRSNYDLITPDYADFW